MAQCETWTASGQCRRRAELEVKSENRWRRVCAVCAQHIVEHSPRSEFRRLEVRDGDRQYSKRMAALHGRRGESE